MSKTAVMWIRDGVLVDRMHINPVAFAFVALAYCDPETRQNTSLPNLINFGFEKSGWSCADKLKLYNAECENILADVESAANYYNVLVSEAASEATFFTGAVELLRDLQSGGIENFITSAVDQNYLDSWCEAQQGRLITPYLSEVLGARQNFLKGKDHFEYVSGLGFQRIYYVADATTEIQTAQKYSQDYNITPVGFANAITADRVMEAVTVVARALLKSGTYTIPFPISIDDIQFAPSRIRLPDQQAIESSLSKAGADSVVTGVRDNLMQNLRTYFEQRSQLQPGIP